MAKNMTNSSSKLDKFKALEQHDVVVPDTWIIVRVDGRHFTKFSRAHGFEKPNDERALQLMNKCAKAVMNEIPDIVFAYGESDEYSFVFTKTTTFYERRASKLVSIVVSLFSATYVMKWPRSFDPAGGATTSLNYAPTFDGRVIVCASKSTVREYLAWRQVDCHVNNLYNTCFWRLVAAGKRTSEAHNALKGTTVEAKFQLLSEQFDVSYDNDVPPIFRNGSIVFKNITEHAMKIVDGKIVVRQQSNLVIEHQDIIGDEFWTNHPYVLRPRNTQQ